MAVNSVNTPSGRSPKHNSAARNTDLYSDHEGMAATISSHPEPGLFKHAGIVAIVVGVLLRVVGSMQDLDQPIWRQSDLWAMARGFLLEDANPFHPRVAWRGVTNGLAESEFPLVPWVTSLFWRVFGEHDYLLRLLPFASGIISLLTFSLIARSLIDARAAWIAIACVSVAPLAVFVGTAVQSDGVMLCSSLLAVLAAVRWTTNQQSWSQQRWPIMLGVSVAVAGLMKPTALHIGVVIAAVLVVRQGNSSLVRPSVIAAGLLGVGLPLAWAWYAHTLYVSTGLSLGISNEHHIAGSELLTNPNLLRGIVSLEARWVWGLAVVPVGFALVTGRRSAVVRIMFAWVASAGLMLLIAGRTTGDGWAYYYHVVMVAPVALLTGVGISEAISRVRRTNNHSALSARRINLAALLVVALIAAPWVRTSLRVVRPQAPSSLFNCAQRVRSTVEPGLLLTSGGIRLDDGGNGVAFDASYMFHWLDRRGWTIALEDQSVENVEVFARQGAVAYFAETDAVAQRPGFADALRRRYRVLAVCDRAATVYDLTG